MYNNIQKYYPRFLFFAKLIILVFAYRLVSQRIFEEGSYVFFLDQLYSLKAWAPWVIIFLLAMTGLNWLFEILKWQRLAVLVQPTSFGQALKQSLSSLTVSLITPNRIGEYGAKALYFRRKHRSRVILFNFISNFSQMSTTILFGALGFWWVYESLPGLNLKEINIMKTGLFVLTVAIGFVIVGKMWRGFYSKLIKDLKSVRAGTLINVFALSLLKYLVFSHQFYFLLVLFGVDLGYLECMSLLSLSYLISSLIPGFVIFDWLVKGSVAVAVFGRFGVDEILVLSITSVMWLLNFGLPSLIGTLYVMAFKPYSANSEAALGEQKKSAVQE
jgi:hypothetical protein